MMSDDEVRQMIAEVTADLRAHPPRLKDIPLTSGRCWRRGWQDDAHQAYSEFLVRRALR